MIIRITHPYISGFWYSKVPCNHPAARKMVLKSGCPVAMIKDRDEHLVVIDELMGTSAEYGGEYYVFSGIDSDGHAAIYELYKRDILSLTELEI